MNGSAALRLALITVAASGRTAVGGDADAVRRPRSGRKVSRGFEEEVRRERRPAELKSGVARNHCEIRRRVGEESEKEAVSRTGTRHRAELRRNAGVTPDCQDAIGSGGKTVHILTALASWTAGLKSPCLFTPRTISGEEKFAGPSGVQGNIAQHHTPGEKAPDVNLVGPIDRHRNGSPGAIRH